MGTSSTGRGGDRCFSFSALLVLLLKERGNSSCSNLCLKMSTGLHFLTLACTPSQIFFRSSPNLRTLQLWPNKAARPFDDVYKLPILLAAKNWRSFSGWSSEIPPIVYTDFLTFVLFYAEPEKRRIPSVVYDRNPDGFTSHFWTPSGFDGCKKRAGSAH